MLWWSARLAAWAQSTQLDSYANLLTSSDEANEGGDLWAAMDDDDPDHPWFFVTNPSLWLCVTTAVFNGTVGLNVDVSPAEGILMSEL